MVYEMLPRLLIAALLGGLVGLEREWAHRPAGLRTHTLVCLGACLFTIIAIDYFGSEASRIVGGIITGIGFLGAGTIIASQTKRGIIGLTTAASIWVVAAIGMGVGMGYIFLSSVAAILVFIILQFKKAEKGLER